jgi:hypothetical protein
MIAQNTAYVVDDFRDSILGNLPFEDDPGIRQELDDYFAAGCEDTYRAASANRPPEFRTYTRAEAAAIGEQVFSILTSRRFANCSKAESLTLKDAAIRRMAESIVDTRPLRFHLDIGGGYSAAIHTDDLAQGSGLGGLSFTPHCLHFLCLRQVARFANEVRQVYPLGIRVDLVIDNLVADYVNEIPQAQTYAFCDRLRSMIRSLGLESLVDLLVESEISDFHRGELTSPPDARGPSLSDAEHDNVQRFCGRHLTRDEAAERQGRYDQVTPISEARLARFLHGVHLTQRKGPETLSFRAFPGASCRLQAGRACFVRNPKGKLVPKLLTTLNVERHELLQVHCQMSAHWMSREEHLRASASP